MMTLRQLAAEPATLPTVTTWYLTDLAEARGKQELFTRQSPQKLKALREHALIESAISSNRIEGVEVDKARVGTLIFGRSALRDRDEAEVRGYRDALVEAAIARQAGDFGIADIQDACPGVSVDLIRQVLKRQKDSARVICLGRGPAAKWRRTAN
jgi:hypothetical protein